ncbi:NAD(P)-binding domain-containing protein [Nocardiopsis chromatogenes]|uniref:NAD(P)-binding domain-containing protein n=1 Tax=Nocardiopsis chromatogenes TaxID=280239 RepID=UPI000346DA24|nr:NAD(P)-binding domain-containing protein [Nocardiopsis chromatogenes]
MADHAEGLPVAVVGAGPVGLAAAAELAERDVPVVVLEKGGRAGAAVAEWGHVRLFSTWRDLVAPAAGKLLAGTGWDRPDEGAYPTGADWVRDYLEPLAAALGERVRFGTEVVGVGRRGRDRVVDSGRATEPFTVRVRTADGAEERILARAVIDASGTWGAPNPLGADGLPALGEAAAADRISYRVPDPAGAAERERYEGRRTAVVGSGHSALTALVLLAEAAERDPATRAVWVLRRGEVGDAFGGGADDRLAARGALGKRAQEAVASGHITVAAGFRTAGVRTGAAGAVLVAEDGRELDPVDEVAVLTGFRPDLSFLSEVRLGLDATLQAPAELAPLIDPNVHSCGTVYPHGARELSHPEPGFYLAGMKSYGRAPTFLALTGFEQVRSIAAEIAGDREAAERVELVLPETGVCQGSGLPGAEEAAQEEATGGGCCGPAAGPQPVEADLPVPTGRR